MVIEKAEDVFLEELLQDREFLEEFALFKSSMKDIPQDMVLFLAFRSIAESVDVQKEEASVYEENISQAFDLISSLKNEVLSLKKSLQKMKNSMNKNHNIITSKD